MTDSTPASLPVKIYLGLGSNLGDRMANLANAIELLSQSMVVKDISQVYETKPLGYEKQPLFLNAVLSALTVMKPFDLLKLAKKIERDSGRKPSFRNSPRPIDIDILFYGDSVMQTARLTIPHPRIAERAFVLVPLADIARDFIHPVYRRSIAELLAVVDGLDGVVNAGELILKNTNK